MAMTMTEKILAAHAGRPEVRPGELIDCMVDFLFANDITAPLAIKEVEKMGVAKVFEPSRLALLFGHPVPTKDPASRPRSNAADESASGARPPDSSHSLVSR